MTYLDRLLEALAHAQGEWVVYDTDSPLDIGVDCYVIDGLKRGIDRNRIEMQQQQGESRLYKGHRYRLAQCELNGRLGAKFSSMYKQEPT